MEEHSELHLMSERIERLADAVTALGLQIHHQFDKTMTTIASFTAAVQASFDKVSSDLDAIQTDIGALNTKITAFQNSPGTLSTADQASLDGIVAAASALQTKADNIVAPVVPPAPPAA